MHLACCLARGGLELLDPDLASGLKYKLSAEGFGSGYMMSAHATAATHRFSETRLRYGTHDDLAAVSRLIHRANQAERAPHIDESELAVVAGRGQLLVLARGEGELAAAACISPGRGLVFLVIDPEIATPELEHRMIEVAAALCESEQPARIRGRR